MAKNGSRKFFSRWVGNATRRGQQPAPPLALTCAHCEGVFEGLTAVDGDSLLRPGDPVVCTGCGHGNYFDGMRMLKLRSEHLTAAQKLQVFEMMREVRHRLETKH